MHDVTHLYTLVQDGNTALVLACKEKHETAAAELIKAGALDAQVAHVMAWLGACVV